jgi:hypothetical protein
MPDQGASVSDCISVGAGGKRGEATGGRVYSAQHHSLLRVFLFFWHEKDKAGGIIGKRKISLWPGNGIELKKGEIFGNNSGSGSNQLFGYSMQTQSPDCGLLVGFDWAFGSDPDHADPLKVYKIRIQILF